MHGVLVRNGRESGSLYLIPLAQPKMFLLQQGKQLIMNSTTVPDVRTSIKLNEQATYDPNRLLDALIEKLDLKNDAALAYLLEVGPPVLSYIRHRRFPVGAMLLIRMHEVSDLSIRELRALMGDHREKFCRSNKQARPEKNGPGKFPMIENMESGEL